MGTARRRDTLGEEVLRCARRARNSRLTRSASKPGWRPPAEEPARRSAAQATRSAARRAAWVQWSRSRTRASGSKCSERPEPRHVRPAGRRAPSGGRSQRPCRPLATPACRPVQTEGSFLPIPKNAQTRPRENTISDSLPPACADQPARSHALRPRYELTIRKSSYIIPTYAAFVNKKMPALWQFICFSCFV